MNIKIVEVGLLSLVLSVMTCSAVAESASVSNARAALSPVALGIVKDMESIEGKRYTEDEVAAAANGEQFAFRAALRTICSECYVDLIEKERHDGNIWTIKKIKNTDWHWKHYLVSPSSENEAAYRKTQQGALDHATMAASQSVDEHGNRE